MDIGTLQELAEARIGTSVTKTWIVDRCGVVPAGERDRVIVQIHMVPKRPLTRLPLIGVDHQYDITIGKAMSLIRDLPSLVAAANDIDRDDKRAKRSK